jgi:hypothetical protein
MGLWLKGKVAVVTGAARGIGRPSPCGWLARCGNGCQRVQGYNEAEKQLGLAPTAYPLPPS